MRGYLFGMLTTGIAQIDSLKQRLHPDWAEERPVGGGALSAYTSLNGGEDGFRRPVLRESVSPRALNVWAILWFLALLRVRGA